MGVRERREREKSETRNRILDAARELFINEGYDGVSMRQVAEKIEYSPTAIYAYFADKEDLFHELCHEDFARLAEMFMNSGMPLDAVERLRFIATTFVKFGIEYPNHYKLMFMTPHPPARLDARDEEIKGNPESDAYAFLKFTVEEAIATGRLREGLKDADLVSQTLFAAVHGVISLQIAKGEDGWVDWRPLHQRVELMQDFALRAMLKTSG
jgi:AcrR family transcriptional regulator